MSDDRYDNHYYNADTFGIQSTAGAIPIRNKKGEISMKKVKVQRYISGKRPDYADKSSSSSSESDDEDFTNKQRRRQDDDEEEEEHSPEPMEEDKREEMREEDVPDLNDPRIRRLMAAKMRDAKNDADEEAKENSETEDRISRHRRIHEPEVLSEGEDENEQKLSEESDDDSSSGDDELDDEGIQRRRELMRQRALMKAQIEEKEELMDKEEEKSGAEDEEEEEETSEEEETTDSEDEEEGTKLKPVFVRKKDRLTVQDREREAAKQRHAEREAQHLAEQRRRQTLKLVEEDVRKQAIARKATNDDPEGLNEVNTDDENEEIEYESWKLRELKRMKRDREERELLEKEREEMERLRNMTEQERRAELKNNPKVITNKAVKGKYKFMQKYYHRGAFYMEEENNLYKRDYSSATLEDKFDKTVLPKVMQVKNFGRSGRTKYTHLVDQDTTHFDAPWSQETTQNVKFQLTHAGGMKQQFERPSNKTKK